MDSSVIMIMIIDDIFVFVSCFLMESIVSRLKVLFYKWIDKF